MISFIICLALPYRRVFLSMVKVVGEHFAPDDRDTGGSDQ